MLKWQSERYIKDKLSNRSLISKKVYFRKGLLIQNSCIISRKSYKYVINYLAFWPDMINMIIRMKLNTKKQKWIHDNKSNLKKIWFIKKFNNMLWLKRHVNSKLNRNGNTILSIFIESPFPIYYMLNINHFIKLS